MSWLRSLLNKGKNMQKLYHHTFQSFSSDIIAINVGGTKYQTLKQTINKYPQSMLSKTSANSNEEVFIDRNGKIFEYILDYMRHEDITLMPIKDETFVKQLLTEAEFYQIEPLINYLNLCRKTKNNTKIFYNKQYHQQQSKNTI